MLKQIFRIGFVFALFAASNCWAGADNIPAGAKQAGMGNAAVAASDIWSTNHNQAGIAAIDKPMASIYVSQGYLISQLSQTAVAVAYPTKLGTFALSINRIGFKLYSENKTGLAFARKFGEGLRIGAQANLVGVTLGDIYGKKSIVTFEAGIQTKLMNNLWLGAHIYNVARSKINAIEKVPIIARFGLQYNFNTKVNSCIEYEKNWVTKPLFKVGIEYNIVTDLCLRVGLNTGANESTFVGAGYHLKQFTIDIATSIDYKLGTSPKLALSYKF